MVDSSTIGLLARTEIPEVAIATRLGLAVIFGAVIGIERELRERSAGLRTHMLTALAAALFTVVTFEIYFAFQGSKSGGNLDPLRIMEAVTTGVSFLAAGVIIRGRGEVRGLTTGASIWLAGAVGVACGAGLYSIAAIAVVLSVVILAVLRLVETRWLDTK